MNSGKKSSSKESPVPDSCPHCGRSLSPWERVLLNVDRALMCKGCWYRIILDVFPGQTRKPDDKKESKE